MLVKISFALRTGADLPFPITQSRKNLSLVKNISQRLAEAIATSGKTKSALASHLGVPQSTVSRWLAGGEPRSERLIEIAKYLGVDVEWLMTGESAQSSISPKHPDVGETAHSASGVWLSDAPRDDVGPDALTIEQRVTRLEHALELIQAALKNI